MHDNDNDVQRSTTAARDGDAIATLVGLARRTAPHTRLARTSTRCLFVDSESNWLNCVRFVLRRLVC
jgi:hypothetical protein